MNGLTFLAVALAGGVGAAARLVVDGVVRARVPASFPLGIMLVNVTGSLVLGLITGLYIGALVSPAWQLILGGGLMGGYTTFSTASYETVRFVQDRRYLAALTNGLGMLVASVLASGLGLWLGLQF